MANIVGTAQINQAAANNPALRQILQQVVTAGNTQATKTNTSGKMAPNQSSAAVAFQNPLYIVTVTDPGGTAAGSLAQQQAQAAAASLGANPQQSVIYHQVQAATSVLFDSASSVETYGGNNGTLNTQFVIADLNVNKQWFFRVRTSFDGSTWNQWKIVGKDATKVNANGVTLRTIAGGQFAGITLPGMQTVGFGIGQLPSGGQIQTADGVILANLLGIAGPAGYIDTGYEASGLTQCSVNSLGNIVLNYGDLANHRWTGAANFLTFGWTVGKQAIAPVTTSDGGKWVVVTLSGGSRVAIGYGSLASSASFAVPTGFTAANSMGVCTPAVFASSATHPAYGVAAATVVNGLCTLTWSDNTGNSWASTLNWFAVAWESALTGNLVSVGSGQYLRLPTPSGDVMLGVGQTHDASYLPLPSGYTYAKALCFATPATFDNVLQYAMHGVASVAVDVGLEASTGLMACLYGTVTGNRPGAAAWFTVAWQ